MATNAKELKQYFADMDAAEEVDAAALGMTPEELRVLRLEPQKVKEARRAERYAQDINEAYRAINDPRSFTPTEVEELELLQAGKSEIPPTLFPSKTAASVATHNVVGLERPGRQLREPVDMPETVPSLSMPSGVPVKTSDFAALQRFMSPGALTAPEAQPIPVANASTRVDATVPTTSALPSTGPKTPAGKPESTGTPGLPAPSSEGAGGDVSERDLYLARLAAQSAAGFGGMGAGKNIDMGIADTLGERLKQVQALRAKREEQGLEQQRERATWGASNRATLASFMAQYKDRPEVVEALKAQEPGADTTKPSDFLKNVVGSLTTPPKVASIQAATKRTGAQTAVAEKQPVFKEREVVVKEKAQKAAEDLSKARITALQNKALVDVTTSSKEAREAKADARAAEAAVTRAMERANDKNDVTNTANNFTALEEVAPGFAKGQKPEWIGRFTLQKAMEVPAISDKAAALNSALENFTANIRKTLFGASLTGNEKASFDLIVNRKLTATPEQLAAAVNTLRRGAARFAQNHFTTSMEFHPQETARVLRSSAVYGPALREGGIYSDVWTLPAAPAPAGQASVSKRKPQPANTTAMRDEGGALKYVPNDQVQAAEAAGWKRE